MQKLNLRDNDQTILEIWLANSSNDMLDSVKLHVSAPSFLEILPETCKGSDLGRDLLLGKLSAKSTASWRYCIRTQSDIKPGDFNVLFLFDYTWAQGSSHFSSYVSAEKTVRARLLGAESLAGVPLALAGFIVPGLFLWITLGIFRVPWSVGTAVGDKIIYSVIVSTLFFFLAAWGHPHWWASKTSVESGISLAKLLWLAGSGVMIGAVVGVADLSIRKIVELRKRANTISPNDDDDAVIEKLVRKHSSCRKPAASVLLKNGEVYSGSLREEGAQYTWIMGWFHIDPKNADDAMQIQLRASAGDPAKLLRLARRAGLDIEAVNMVRVRDQGGEKPSGQLVMRFLTRDVNGSFLQQNKGELESITLG